MDHSQHDRKAAHAATTEAASSPHSPTHHDHGALVHDADTAHAHHPAGGTAQGHAGHHADMVDDFRRRFWVSLILTVPILLLSPMVTGWIGLDDTFSFKGDQWLLLGLSTIVYLYGGFPFLKGLVDELRAKRPGMMTLVAMAITVAYLYSVAVVFGLHGMAFFWETVTLIDLMLLGHWIEMRSVLGASRALEELVLLMPAEAHRLNADGSIVEVPTVSLVEGDRVMVKPGEKVPADGVIVEGRSALNESMLTGESRPVEKGADDEVVAGAINGTGSLTVEVTRTGEASYLAQVIQLVRSAQESKSRTQDLANRAALLLTVVALVVGAGTFVAWRFVADHDLAFALERMVTVMVVACPHALGLAVPLVVAVSTSISARNGLLIRDRAAFERAREIDTIVFDKTGTLTEGRFGVTDIVRFDEAISDDEILRVAAGVESQSEHPIAAGVVATAIDRKLDIPTAEEFASTTGEGVEAMVEGRRVRVVGPNGLRALGMTLAGHEEEVDRLGRQGKTVVFVLRDDLLIGGLALADVIRPESKEAIARLHAMGIDAAMLTGDKKEVAEWVAAELGLDRVFAEVLPDQKSAMIASLQKEGKKVAMTGDGVNDAPALAQADVGIAIGAGTDVAVETADVVLVRSDPRDVTAVIELSRATYRKMRQNLWYAAGYNIVAIPLAAGVLASQGILLSPAVGAVLMSLSTIVVAINARLLK